MCGRDALYGQVSRLREAFDAEPEGFDFEPRWNAASMQLLPVVRQRPTGERLLRVAASRWRQAGVLHPSGRERVLRFRRAVGTLDEAGRQRRARHVHDRHHRGQRGDAATARPHAGDLGAGGLLGVVERGD